MESRSRVACPLGVVRDKLENGGPCSCSQSSFQPPPGLDLPPARCFVEAEKDGACQADGPLVNSDEPCRDLVNSEWLKFVGPVLEVLSQGNKMDYVFKFDCASYLSAFKGACRDLKIQLVSYQSRHSGPSIDNSKEGKLAKQAKCSTLRGSRATLSSAVGMSVSRTMNRGHHASFADFFAGSGRVARAARALGF